MDNDKKFVITWLEEQMLHVAEENVCVGHEL